MLPIDNPVIPKGSLIFITGTTGLVGSHIADQFLHYGYRVRGTTRDVEKNTWLTKIFDTKYGPGKFELVQLTDYTTPDPIHELLKDGQVSVVVHTATELGYNPDPNVMVPAAIGMTMAAVRATARVPSVKRFVLTSSLAAALLGEPDVPGTITADTWNDGAVEAAFRPPPYEAERFYQVYGASKTLSEREAWRFVREEKPGFVLNSVLPTTNFGPSLDPLNQGHPTTAGMLEALFKGDTASLVMIGPQYFVDVRDTGRLHVAAAVLPGVESERIFGAAETFNGDSLLAILRRLYPGRKFPDNFMSGRYLYDITPRARAGELLKDLGHDGWVSLEDSVRANTDDLAED
ncbi:hypothetical protein Micbo1qcDRAFT_153578 [Microdochium bolleyi]|uniref:NAD-dependent epimerase/dehydratase domain-containing protein n=1 Tax=Microdochium bolleyi TaxID=196109 RepID=A0A136ILY7_9PEZI|nr:hypothetical protein Micbo1qcDRAFT_153578 [Microdochium bolleyi]